MRFMMIVNEQLLSAMGKYNEELSPFDGLFPGLYLNDPVSGDEFGQA